MKHYVALLRGINVGGNCKVPMSELRKIFLALGFHNVSTYINSGNVLFATDISDSEVIAHSITITLEKHFGFPIPCIIRSKKQLLKTAQSVPAAWMNDGTQKTDILFLWNTYDSKKSLELINPTPNVDHLSYVKGAIIWNVGREHFTKTAMKKFIGSPLYKHMTARNVNTVRKLATLLEQ